MSPKAPIALVLLLAVCATAGCSRSDTDADVLETDSPADSELSDD